MKPSSSPRWRQRRWSRACPAAASWCLIGDPAQIDNPYVDSRSNGLVYTRQRMRGQPFAAHVPLAKGERSPLAEAGARLL